MHTPKRLKKYEHMNGFCIKMYFKELSKEVLSKQSFVGFFGIQGTFGFGSEKGKKKHFGWFFGRTYNKVMKTKHDATQSNAM